MKTVLVAVDFSKTSLNVLDYAVHFAGKAGANIVMAWVDNITNDEATAEGAISELRNEKIELFKELQNKYSNYLKPRKIDFKAKKGKVYIEISNLARAIKADFILAGTHGVSGFEEFWIGSNAYRIVTHASCPAITLRLDFEGRDIRNIIMPIDSTQETRQKIPITTELAVSFKSRVHVVSLYSTHLKSVQKRVDNYASQAMQYLADNKVKTVSARLEADNITKATIDYTLQAGGDLISIMTEQETTTANLFLGTYAQQMMYNAPVPIMTVRSKELMQIPVR